jgi:hypothetical protein
MLTTNERNILAEIRDEIAGMITRQRVIMQDKSATVFNKLVAHITLQTLVSIEVSILALNTFIKGAYDGVDTVERVRRIVTTTEWEAFNTQYETDPEVIYPPHEKIMAINFGEGKDSTVFANALKQADEEIELGIINTYKAGTVVTCGYCCQLQTLEKDGALPAHDDANPLYRKLCPGSFMILNLSPRGRCRGCGGAFVLDAKGYIPEHGSLKGHYGGESYKAPCAGSGLPPEDADPGFSKTHGSITPDGYAYIGVACRGSEADRIAGIGREAGFDKGTTIHNLQNRPESIVVFKAPATVFTLVLTGKLKDVAKQNMGLNLTFWYGKTQDDVIRKIMREHYLMEETEKPELPAPSINFTYQGQCAYCHQYVPCNYDGILSEHLMPTEQVRCEGSGVKAVKSSITLKGFTIRPSSPESGSQTPGSGEGESSRSDPQ